MSMSLSRKKISFEEEEYDQFMSMSLSRKKMII
jgi:hypothetical protein